MPEFVRDQQGVLKLELMASRTAAFGSRNVANMWDKYATRHRYEKSEYVAVGRRGG